MIVPYRGVWPRIADGVFVAPSAVVAGDVVIEAGASVWFGAVIRADVASVRVGQRSNIQDNCTIHTDTDIPCTIGQDCSVGHNAVVHGATLGDRVLVGIHATVLNQVQVGDDCLIAAGALVLERTTVPSGQVVMGLPGKVVRPVTDAERERILSGSQHYQMESHLYADALEGGSSDEHPAASDTSSSWS